MKILSPLIALFILVVPLHAHAQDLSHFLDKVLDASKLDSCDATQKALDAIPKDEFNAALSEIKTLKDQELLSEIAKKFDQLNELTTRCPSVQDGFVNKLSRLAVQAQIQSKPQDSAQSIQAIRDFLDFSTQSIENVSCQASAQNFSKIPQQTCTNAIHAFQVLTPSSLPDDQYQSLASRLEKILIWVNQCPDFKIEYEKCLTPDSVHFLDLTRLTPFFDLLDEVRIQLTRMPCDKIQTIRVDESKLKSASQALKSLSPSQFSPQDRATIQNRMKSVYDAAKRCPESHAFVDALIERIYQ